MFKLRNIQLDAGFTPADLAQQLVSNVVYTYGDRVVPCGYEIVDIPGEGESESGTTLIKDTVLCAKPDATMLATEYSTGYLAVIPFSSDEVTFAGANGTLLAAIAQLLGYQDYVVYSAHNTNGKRGHHAWTNACYDWATDTPNFAISKQLVTTSLANRILWYAPNASPAMFIPIESEEVVGPTEQVAPNAVLQWRTGQIRIPMEYYLTDMQNVQDAARQAVLLNAAVNKDQFDTLTTAYGAMAGMLGNISVFGNTVKDVTERYNNITQYIPRP